MEIEALKRKIKLPLRQATLVFLVREDKVLLAMKKRGFGVGRFNGVGGKVKLGETCEQAAIRETREEISVETKKLKRVAVLDFYFLCEEIVKDFNQQVVVYFCDSWSGKPCESEEMKPKWFDMSNLPFDKMWPDDIFWLPKVLEGKFVRGEFGFGQDQGVEYKRIRTKT